MNKLLKKIAAIFLSAVIATLTLMVTFVLLIPTKDQVLDSLPKYEKKGIYSSGDFQDFTDYAKYFYQISQATIAQNKFLRPLAEEDIPKIIEYLENFEEWVCACQELPAESFDFDKSIISVGDYFYVSNYNEEQDRAFWNYNLYYFDMDASVLFFLHNNI